MKTLYKIIITAMLFSVTGCYPMISGRVVDAETGKPLEGAVARAEWHHEKGLPGLSYSELYSTGEALTDSKGKFRMAGAFPFFAPSRLVIYKKGYIAWREYAVFPGYGKREDCCINWFKWFPGLFRLERFVEGVHSHDEHTSYIHGAGLSGLDSSSNLHKAYWWEEMLGLEENELSREKWNSPERGKKSRKEIRKEAIRELYLQQGGK